jgi:long-subunit acyl-CoA synthetase (AMP-forming)
MLPELKSALIKNLKEKAYPVFSFPDSTIPAASLWTASRVWVHHFREIGLKAGDRVILKIPESPAFLAILIASIWENLTLCVLPPNEDVADKVAFFDARLSISNSSDQPYNISTTDLLNPDKNAVQARETHNVPTENQLFIVRSSGTSSNGRWSVLSLKSVLSVLNSHLPELSIQDEEIMLSVLPWHHSFGLVLDLLPALLHQVEVHRITDGGKDLAQFISKIYELRLVRLNAVPLHIIRLLEADSQILVFIHAGIIGGACIPEKLVNELNESKMRVGYGQTEASPGICLGGVGHFHPNGLGFPLGCSVQLDAENQLYFKGSNAFSGYWTEHGFIKNEHEFIPTGDIVHYEKDGSLSFDGRIDDKIKLVNGREIHPLELENKLLKYFPELIDVCILTTNFEDLALFILPSSPSFKLTEKDLPTALGSLGSLIKHTYYLSPSEWKKTPKGDKNRIKIKETILSE